MKYIFQKDSSKIGKQNDYKCIEKDSQEIVSDYFQHSMKRFWIFNKKSCKQTCGEQYIDYCEYKSKSQSTENTVHVPSIDMPIAGYTDSTAGKWGKDKLQIIQVTPIILVFLL